LPLQNKVSFAACSFYCSLAPKGASDAESSDSKDNSNAQEAERLATENGYDDAHDLKKICPNLILKLIAKQVKYT